MRGVWKQAPLYFFDERVNNMEGYFPVCKYAELTGLSKDTIHHRAIRGTVDCFKNSEGRWFLYYCDDEFIKPEGYLTVEEFAEKVGRTKNCVHGYIRKKIIDPKYIMYKKANLASYVLKGQQPWIFIKEDAAFIPQIVNRYYKLKLANEEIILKLQSLKPSDDYLTVSEWVAKESLSKHMAYNWIKEGLIPYVKVENHYFIPKDQTIDDVAKTRFERRQSKEWLQKTKRVLQP